MRAIAVRSFQPLALLVLLATPLFAGAGCTKATPIGTVCKTKSDCHDVGQICAPGFDAGPSICTHTCTGNSGLMGCPVGYDCFPTDPAQGQTCNKARYEVDKTTGAPLLFGVSCGLNPNVCTTLGSTNAAPACRKIRDVSQTTPTPVMLDPNAYCSGVCVDDGDCPLDFECVTDYDMAKKCLKRSLCSPCKVNLNCGGDFDVCIPTKDGTDHYCSKACAMIGDCGGNQNTAFVCDNTTDVTGATVTACEHRFGACVGQGDICDPCRNKQDCAKTSSSCIENSATGERFCTKQCTSDAVCMSGAVPSACDDTDVYDPTTNPGGMSLQFCNGDVMHVMPGLFSCYLPM